MKAQIHLLESVIAIAMMTMIFLLIFSINQNFQATEDKNKYRILVALEKLDETGELRTYALEKNSSYIENYLKEYLPLEIKVAFFNLTSNLTSIPILPEENVITLSYYLAGDYGRFKPLEVRVYAW